MQSVLRQPVGSVAEAMFALSEIAQASRRATPIADALVATRWPLLLHIYHPHFPDALKSA
jgi:hypothetical protein